VKNVLFNTFMIITISIVVTLVVLLQEYRSLQTEVWFLDVGQGDSVLFKSSRGKVVLVDGGLSDLVLLELGEVLSFSESTIDALFISHPHADHIGGVIQILEKYNVRNIYVNALEYDSDYVDVLKNQLSKIQLSTFVAGEVVQIDEFTITSLWPEESTCSLGINECAMSLLVEVNGVSILSTSDVEFDQFAKLGVNRVVDILKIPHQGSCNDNAGEWLSILDPRYMVVSVGENSYGHPCKQLLALIDNLGGEFYRTDHDGRIGFVISEIGQISPKVER